MALSKSALLWSLVCADIIVLSIFSLLAECSEYAELDVMARKTGNKGLSFCLYTIAEFGLLARAHGLEWNRGCNTSSGERGWASSRVESGPHLGDKTDSLHF